MPQVELNFQDAIESRDAGIAKCESTADAIDPNWRNEAFELLKRFLSECPGEFKVEEVRAYAAMYDFVEPASKRIWGSIILKAARKGLIRKLRVEPVTNKKAHCAFASVWESVKQAS